MLKSTEPSSADIQLEEIEAPTGSERERKLAQSLKRLSQEIMSESEVTQGCTYSGFCMVQLPHRRQPDDEIWVVNYDNMVMSVEPGTSPVDRRRRIGVPFGARARMIMLYIQTQAFTNNNAEVELGASMHNWMARMDIGVGGKTYRELRDQLERIMFCKMTFSETVGDRNVFINNNIVEAGELISFNGNKNQGAHWNDRILLSDRFFQALTKYPVIVREEAIKKLSGNSAALDIYIWLAQLLPSLTRDKRRNWISLFEQFGGGYGRERDWRRNFQGNLARVLEVYPCAQVRKDATGLVLRPSQSPLDTVLKTVIQVPVLPPLL